MRRVNTCEDAPSCIEGSAAKANSLLLTGLFTQGFTDMGLPSGVSPMTGGSDFYPFVLVRNPPFWSRLFFNTKTDHFAKAGSGQTQETLRDFSCCACRRGSPRRV